MLTPLLQLIGKWTWVIEVVVLFSILLFSLKGKKINSSLVAMTVAVTLGLIMRSYAPYLRAVTGLEYYPYVLFANYVGFMAIDTIAIYVLARLHAIFTIRYSFISKMIIMAFFIKAQLHFIRYGERLLMGFDSDYLKPYYQAGISAVNIGLATMSLVFVIAITLSRYRISRGLSGLNWVL